MSSRTSLVLALVLLSGCPVPPPQGASDGGPADARAAAGQDAASSPDAEVSGQDAAQPFDASPAADAASAADAGSCQACLTGNDCPAGAVCLQLDGNDYCAKACSGAGTCAAGESCLVATAFDGTQVQVCIAATGVCGAQACGTCATGTVCDVASGSCVPVPGDAGTPATDHCGTLVGPSASSCCHSCTPGSGTCQANGCYGGWWCDTSGCRCRSAPTSCGGADGGGLSFDAGLVVYDAGPPPTGTVGPNGGSVSRMYFAVTGDTRPGNEGDTAGYPTPIIQKIFEDVEAMSPRPQFMLATGDFVFANPGGGQAAPQLALYAAAAAHYTGTLFPVMGNHECDGYTADNCAGGSTPSNFAAYQQALLTPIGKTEPYYAISINALDSSWTAKLIVTACNQWDAAQQTWLSSALAQSTTYTIVARHMPSSTYNAPCVSEVDALLASHPYNLLLVGHSHLFRHNSREVVVGIGGAPLTGSGNYGFATVEQTAAGFLVTQYDYLTALPVQSFTVPY